MDFENQRPLHYLSTGQKEVLLFLFIVFFYQFSYHIIVFNVIKHKKLISFNHIWQHKLQNFLSLMA
jgi:hypothetical protein